MNFKQLDEKAMQIAQKYKNCEKELLEVVMQMDQAKAFYRLGYSSLFSYVTERLKLSSALAYNFIAVARKSREVPELKKEIFAGHLSISKARKMTSVINRKNQSRWLEIAKSSSQRQLEREVALASSKEAVREKASYVLPGQEIKEKASVLQKVPRIQLQVGLSEKIMLKLRRAQDLESKKNQSIIDLEATLDAVLEVYLEKRDPVKKANRQKVRGRLIEAPAAEPAENPTEKPTISSKSGDANGKNSQLFPRQAMAITGTKSVSHVKKTRLPIPAKIRHQIQLREQGQCGYVDSTGKRCWSRRYLEIHHLHPVSRGGGNNLENLLLVCSGHHNVLHSKSSHDSSTDHM